MNADPAQYPDAHAALAIIRGHFLWLFVLLSISCMNLMCVALAILLHFAFDKFINWVIPDAYSRVREILTAASVAAFGVITVVLLGEMLWTFIKFRTPAHSAKAAFSQPLPQNAQIPAAVPNDSTPQT